MLCINFFWATLLLSASLSFIHIHSQLQLFSSGMLDNFTYFHILHKRKIQSTNIYFWYRCAVSPSVFDSVFIAKYITSLMYCFHASFSYTVHNKIYSLIDGCSPHSLLQTCVEAKFVLFNDGFAFGLQRRRKMY